MVLQSSSCWTRNNNKNNNACDTCIVSTGFMLASSIAYINENCEYCKHSSEKSRFGRSFMGKCISVLVLIVTIAGMVSYVDIITKDCAKDSILCLLHWQEVLFCVAGIYIHVRYRRTVCRTRSARVKAWGVAS